MAAPHPTGPLGQQPQLAEQIAAHVRELVMSGELRLGEFLRLDTIATQLGTSVTPVREAMLLLRGEDMVRQLPRRGYVVAPLSRVDVEDLFAVQAQLAGELAVRATRQLDQVAVTELRGLERRTATALRHGGEDELEQLEYEFHRSINAAAHSPKLAHLLGVASRYLPQRFYSSDSAWRLRAIRDHRRFMDALRSRDAEAARAAMSAHVLDGADRLIRHLGRIGFWDQ